MDGISRGSVGSGWELRLGKLQVAVWLGLSLGAIAGGYFVGFFSGRYVGFESAREISSADLAKLPAPNSLAGAIAMNPNGVYDRLKDPAILRDFDGPRASVKVTDSSLLRKQQERGALIQDEIKEPPAKRATVSEARKLPDLIKASDGSQGDFGDDIFDDSNVGDRLIIGSEGGVGDRVSENVPSSVRILGSNKQTAGSLVAPPKAVDSSQVSAEDVLDARIEQLRKSANTVPNSETKTPLQGKKNAVEEVEQNSSSGGLVRRVLPPGYFAQVSAPKKMSEAEAVAKRLKRSGFPVVIESATVNGQSFYRVLVGPEENKVQADRLVGQLQSESYVTSKPFIRKVK